MLRFIPEGKYKCLICGAALNDDNAALDMQGNLEFDADGNTYCWTCAHEYADDIPWIEEDEDDV